MDVLMFKGVCLDYVNFDVVYYLLIVYMVKMMGLMVGERYSYALLGSETTRSFRVLKMLKKYGKEMIKIVVVGDMG